MTDTDRMVVWLREAMDAAQRDAEAAKPGPWSVDDPSYAEAIRAADGTDVVAGGRWGGEASVFESTQDAVHIARHDPAAVLRRIAADRKTLDLHRPEPGQHPDFCGYDKHELPCPGLRLLAEGYGWTEETT